jgi:hypothetical protein
LWPIARECLQQPEHAKVGKEFAQRALDASRRHRTRELSAAILKEWISIATKTGDTEEATTRTAELERVLKP